MEPEAEVPPFGMLSVSVKAQHLLTVNKQWEQKEDAELGAKPEGFLPQVTQISSGGCLETSAAKPR